MVWEIRKKGSIANQCKKKKWKDEVTDQAEGEFCKNYVENGKKSFKETINYTDVGNKKNSVFLLPMLFSTWNDSFSGDKVTLQEAESVFQGLKWGE